MSEALFGLGGLRFWSEAEIQLREAFIAIVAGAVKRKLVSINPAWRFCQVEGPSLSPAEMVSSAYTSDDVFVTNHAAGNGFLCLRAETTATSYAWATHLLKTTNAKLPFCVWQVGKSFRRETNDGASASKLRFNEFHQIEFQCIYSDTTKADYRGHLMEAVSTEIERFTMRSVKMADSDRLPSYSESTIDIMLNYDADKWREVASCSIRNDFSPDTKNCEIAIGLDRVVSLAK